MVDRGQRRPLLFGRDSCYSSKNHVIQHGEMAIRVGDTAITSIRDTPAILPTSLQMRHETVEGFVNENGLFEPKPGSHEVVDRWVSTIFNARPKTDDPQARVGLSLRGLATNIQRTQGDLWLRLETVAGDFPTRGGFHNNPDGSSIGNRWVSDFMNVRPKAEGSGHQSPS